MTETRESGGGMDLFWRWPVLWMTGGAGRFEGQIGEGSVEEGGRLLVEMGAMRMGWWVTDEEGLMIG